MFRLLKLSRKEKRNSTTLKGLKGVTYATDHLVVFGTAEADDPDLRNQYDLEIVARGNVKAWIRMTQGKARLAVKYER
jgi:hypothetical protein